MKKLYNDLIACVRAALREESVLCDVGSCVELAYAHGVTNLLYYAAARMPKEAQLEEKMKSMLKHNTYTAIVRETIQRQQLNEVFRRFEDSGIRCVALKGSVIKELYPKPELRYMSDIDILIDPEKASEVKAHFEQMGYRVMKFDKGATDQYLSPEGVNFEVKKTLRNEGFSAQTRAFLDRLLLLSEPIEGHRFVCQLPNEEHYAYILCHIVKHLVDGGIGIRPIMDIWMCKKQMKLDEAKLEKLLLKLDLTKFAQTVEHLAFVWFENAEKTQLDEQLGEYILGSGAFGTDEQRVVDRMLKQKNRFTYTLKRLFPPYIVMRRYFPSLKKCPLLLPFYWVWRWFQALLFRRKNISRELATVESTEVANLSARAEFYRRCGLEVYKK